MKTKFTNVLISTDKNLLDLNFIHEYLRHSYWAKDRTREKVEICITNSMCFGVYLHEKQIGFARLVSDYAVFAYLMDVFIIDEQKGKGYGSELLDYILNSPELRRVENWKLATLNAHEFYSQKGFNVLKRPESIMEKMSNGF
jgi:N-acetylglutamate synthase-like GNAT family acetyltransferase